MNSDSVFRTSNSAFSCECVWAKTDDASIAIRNSTQSFFMAERSIQLRRFEILPTGTARIIRSSMIEQELQQLRREKWRLDGKAIRTIEQARAFLEGVGFCLMFPLRPAMPLPTFMGAFVGADDRLPTWKDAYSDPRAAEATELMVRLFHHLPASHTTLFHQ